MRREFRGDESQPDTNVNRERRWTTIRLFTGAYAIGLCISSALAVHFLKLPSAYSLCGFLSLPLFLLTPKCRRGIKMTESDVLTTSYLVLGTVLAGIFLAWRFAAVSIKPYEDGSLNNYLQELSDENDRKWADFESRISRDARFGGVRISHFKGGPRIEGSVQTPGDYYLLLAIAISSDIIDRASVKESVTSSHWKVKVNQNKAKEATKTKWGHPPHVRK